MYRVVTYREAMRQTAALPIGALACYAQVLGVLELTPWNGMPYNEDNPVGAMRQLTFGAHGEGMVTYLVLEVHQRVDVSHVLWLPHVDDMRIR